MSVWGFYGRVSSQEQVGNNSLPTQREAAHTKAESHGASHVIDFIDAGVPGDLSWVDRPALSQLLELVERGQLAGVVVYDPDRLARDLGVQLAVTEILVKHQVQLEFVTQDYNASPEGILFYQLRGAVSQFEKAKIRERTMRGRKRVLEAGKPLSPIRTYGLNYDRKSNAWTIIESEAAVIRQMFAWRQAGLGTTSIVARLDEAGFPPPQSLRWWKNSVRKMLENPAYKGDFCLQRWNLEGVHKNRFLPKERRISPAKRPADQWVHVAVPAIVSRETWDAVQVELAESQRKWSGRTGTYPYLASRLLRCGQCGSSMHGATPRPGDSYYRCNGRYGELKLDCDMPHLPGADLDAALWEAVRAWLIQPERYYRALADAEAAVPVPDSPVGDAHLVEVRNDIARLERLVADQVVHEGDVRHALRELREREAALAHKKAARRREPEPPVELHALPPDIVDSFDTETRTRHVRAVVEKVVAHVDGRLELEPRRRRRSV